MDAKYSEGEWKVVHELNVECGRRSIATCGFNSSDQSEMAKSKWNAKLIAAAPDLLKELMIMVECWDKDVFTDVDIECARMAIKKATE